MVSQRGRDLAVPSFVTLAVVAFVGYFWFQGRSHTVEYAVTRGEIAIVPTSSPRVPPSLREDAPADRMLLVEAAWQAAESIDGGSYYVLVSVPPGWRNYACEPECEWGTTPDLKRYAEALPVDTFRLAARFDADEMGRVTVAFVPRRPGVERDPATEPSAWLVQTDGDNVLQKPKLIS